MSRFDQVVRRAVIKWGLSAIAILLLAAPLFAEVEVTLKSGASLVGEVKIVENDALVKIDDAELKVPLSQIDSIAAVDVGPERQAQRLLLTALTTKLTKEGDSEVIGLLAEASRLAPKDPQIAFWYASSLADAGYGQAASDILTKQRDAVAAVYPGLTDQLESRIKKRVAMEKMPPALVERIDSLSATMSKQAPNAETRQMAAVFRLVDQDEFPIDQADFQIQINGQDQNLEAFEDGYYVFTYNLNRGNDEQPCHLDITRPGLESKAFDFSASSNRVHDAGKLSVKRYADDAMRPFRVQLSDDSGKPVVAAQITLHPMSARGSVANHTLSGETDVEGRAVIMAFPMKYSYQVRAEGYNGLNGSYELKAVANETDELKLRAYRAVQATIRVVWESSAPQGGKTSGETTLDVGTGAPQNYAYGQDPTPWLRPVQQKERLTLSFVESPFGYHGPFGGDTWVRIIDSAQDSEASDAKESDATTAAASADAPATEPAPKEVEKKPATLEQFNALDLDDIDDLKKKLPQPRSLGGGQAQGPRPPMVLPAKKGTIYFGRAQNRDMRTGQPIQLAFKVFIEEMGTGVEE